MLALMWCRNGRRSTVSPWLLPWLVVCLSLLLQVLSFTYQTICEKFDLKWHHVWNLLLPPCVPESRWRLCLRTCRHTLRLAALRRHTAHAHLGLSISVETLQRCHHQVVFFTDLSDEHEPCWTSTWLRVSCGPWCRSYDILCSLTAVVVKWWLFFSFCIWRWCIMLWDVFLRLFFSCPSFFEMVLLMFHLDGN